MGVVKNILDVITIIIAIAFILAIMETIKNILDAVMIIIAIVLTLAMLQKALMLLKKSLEVNRDKISVGSSNHKIPSLDPSDFKSLNDLITNLRIEFKEFSDKVNFSNKVNFDRVSETIREKKAKEQFRQVCYRISKQINIVERIPRNSSLYDNLDKVIAFLKRSADSKQPIVDVTLEYKLHLPIGNPLSGKLREEFNGEDLEKYREKYRSFLPEEETYSWLGIELIYKEELLEAPITSKKFKEFLEEKIKKIDDELRHIPISEERKMVDNPQKTPSYGFDSANITIHGGAVFGSYGTLNNFSFSQDPTDNAATIQTRLAELQQQGMAEEEAQKQVAKNLATQAEKDSTMRDKLVKLGKFLSDTAGKTSVSEATKVAVTNVLRLAGVPLP